MGQFPQDGNLALRVSFFWFTFMRSCIHKFAPKHFLKVLGQNSGLVNPKNVKKMFQKRPKTARFRPLLPEFPSKSEIYAIFRP